MIPKILRKIITFHFLTSTIFFINISTIPLIIYESIESGGLNKFGYTSIQDTSSIRACVKILSSFISMSCGLFSSLINCNIIMSISSICFVIGMFSFRFLTKSILSFALLSISIDLGNLLRQIAIYRYIDICSKKYGENVRNKSFRIYFVTINLSCALGFIISGIMRQHLGYELLFTILSIASLLTSLFTHKILYVDRYDLKEKSNIDNSIFIHNNYPTIHMLSFYISIICIFIFAYSTCMPYFYKLVSYFCIVMSFIAIIFMSGNKIYSVVKQIKISSIGLSLVLVSACMTNKAIFVSIDLGEMPMINWINKYVNTCILGRNIPAEAIGSVTPISICLLGSYINDFICRLKEGNYIKTTHELMYGMLFLIIGSFCFIFMQYEYDKFLYNSLLIPILYYFSIAMCECICGPASANYQSKIVPNEYIGHVIVMTQTLFATTSTLFTIIPHKSFVEQNLLPVFYLSLSIYSIVLIFIIMSGYIYNKYSRSFYSIE